MEAQEPMKQNFMKHIATQGAVGYSQAPGTIATLMMIPFVWFLHSLHLSLPIYLSITVCCFLFGWYIVSHTLPLFDEQDPSAIVIDEMVSFIVVFAGVPFNLMTLMIGFVCFRLLDIYKPLGISYIDHLYGVPGIMLDDLAAALLTNLLLHSLYYMHWLS